MVDRFAQIEPKVLMAVDGYRYNGTWHDRRDALAEIRRRLPTLEATVLVGLGPGGWRARGRPGCRHHHLGPAPGGRRRGRAGLRAGRLDHPLWVLYSSGTTGLPKAIVQGHGGIALELAKSISLHLRPGPRRPLLLVHHHRLDDVELPGRRAAAGVDVALYDGSPGHPDIGALWRFAERAGIYFGTSAAFVLASMKAGVEAARETDPGGAALDRVDRLPLLPEGFACTSTWPPTRSSARPAAAPTSAPRSSPPALCCRSTRARSSAGPLGLRWRASTSTAPGGRPGRRAGRHRAAAQHAAVPLNDPDGERYQDSYFSTWPGVWRHGDWLEITERGTCIISGRSDSTLNRGGVRMGTAEFYRVVEGLDEVVDSLVVDVSDPGGEGRLLLFVVLRPGVELDDGLRDRDGVRSGPSSPRHVPDRIDAIAEVPRTLSGRSSRSRSSGC